MISTAAGACRSCFCSCSPSRLPVAEPNDHRRTELGPDLRRRFARLRRPPAAARCATSSTTTIAPGSRRTPPPEAYASGVRLFALKSKKKELTCDELAHGRTRPTGAPGVLRGADGAI